MDIEKVINKIMLDLANAKSSEERRDVIRNALTPAARRGKLRGAE